MTKRLALAKCILLIALRKGFTMCILKIKRSPLRSFLGWILRSTVTSKRNLAPGCLLRKVKKYNENQSVPGTAMY